MLKPVYQVNKKGVLLIGKTKIELCVGDDVTELLESLDQSVVDGMVAERRILNVAEERVAKAALLKAKQEELRKSNEKSDKGQEEKAG